MERYIGLDDHSTSCTLAVMSPSGKRLLSQVVETNGRALVNFIRSIPGDRYLCIEEGTRSSWLYELLSPHVHGMVVLGVKKRKGQKSDKLDAFGMADKARTGNFDTRVYKGLGELGALLDLSRGYTAVKGDSVRVQNRIKTLYRSRGISTRDDGIYSPSLRPDWLKKLPPKTRPRAQLLYMEHDYLIELRGHAQKAMIKEAKNHRVFHTIRTVPGLGAIRVAQMLPIVVTPYRFANKGKFWAYIGMAIVLRSSSDWVRSRSGDWVRADVQQTRGLNRNYNRALKDIFKGAATTVIGCAKDEPLYRHYQELLANGTKPNLAKLTIARQIASITLSIWRSGQEYDPNKLKRDE
jgi:transposase